MSCLLRPDRRAARTRKPSSTTTPRRSSHYYRDHGYVQAHVGAPELKVLEDSKDKKTRWIELRVPVTEGARYKVGEFDVRRQHRRQDRRR